MATYIPGMKILSRFLIAAAMVLPMTAEAAPKPDLWEHWVAHDEASIVTVDHSAWDRFLDTYVTTGADGINRVAYAGVAPQDRQSLTGYVALLAQAPVGGLRRAEQLALWLNLYNALTVMLVLDHYPVASILDIDISPGFFSNGPWDKKLVEVGGETVSLNDIEHRILRPIWKDPRIHYALNCAALGCPNLSRRAFTGDTVDAMLGEAARAYVNHPRGARIENGRLTVSSIYDWYEDDFGGGERGVIEHLKRYAGPALGAALAGIDDIDGDGYDWSLNEAR